MAEVLQRFHPAPVGWYVWYRNHNVPGRQGLIRRVIAGWGVYIDKINTPQEEVTKVIPLTYSRTTHQLLPSYPAFPGFSFIGVQWPGMTSRELKTLLDGQGEDSPGFQFPHTPTLPF